VVSKWEGGKKAVERGGGRNEGGKNGQEKVAKKDALEGGKGHSPERKDAEQSKSNPKERGLEPRVRRVKAIVSPRKTKGSLFKPIRKGPVGLKSIGGKKLQKVQWEALKVRRQN